MTIREATQPVENHRSVLGDADQAYHLLAYWFHACLETPDVFRTPALEDQQRELDEALQAINIVIANNQNVD